MTRSLFALTLVAAILLAACGSQPAQSAGNGQADLAAAGKPLFATNCGECHSDDGSGTDEAPAVLGHTGEQVRTQVRTPEGDMKAIAPDKLSDVDLEKIVAFVVSLDGAQAHPDVEVAAEQRPHLEAALEAIKDHEDMDRELAISHLEQALALADGQTADLYQSLINAVKGKKAGNARHELKELLGMGHD